MSDIYKSYNVGSTRPLDAINESFTVTLIKNKLNIYYMF